jgi:transposase-like protein
VGKVAVIQSSPAQTFTRLPQSTEAPPIVEPPKKYRKLTKEQRQEVVRRALAGESQSAIAREFGITRQAVDQQVDKALHPEKIKQQREKKLTKRLTEAQAEELGKLFETTTPEDHQLPPAGPFWTLDHGLQLAKKRFDKSPSVASMKSLIAPYLKKPKPFDHGDPMPLPPKPRHISQIDPELAKNQEYVDYYLSPLCMQIAQREYEWALREWKQRNPDGEKPPVPPAPSASIMPPGTFMPRRTGKHAKSRGSNYTPPKKRKKRRK